MDVQTSYTPPSFRRSWLICIVASLFFLFEFIQLNMFNSLNHEFMRAFSVSAQTVSQLSATYLYADVLFLIPAGLLIDRFSTKFLIMIAMGVTIISTYVFAFSHSLYLVAFCHFAEGFGNAFSLMSCLVLASRWFPHKKMALVTGCIVTMAMMGGVLAQTPLTLLNNLIGWRYTVFAIAVLGTVFLGIICWVVQDYPHHYPHKKHSKEFTHFHGYMRSLRNSLLNPANWCFGIYTSLLNLPIFILGALWGTLFLHQAHHFSLTDASLISSMIFIGTIVGSPVLGWLSDTIRQRRKPMIICAAISIVIISIINYLPHMSLFEAILLFFTLGFFTSAQVLSYPCITESNPHSETGTSLSFASVIIMGGGALSQPLIGWLMDQHWQGKLIDDIPFYSIQDYHKALTILPWCFLVALLMALICKETYCDESISISTLEEARN